MPSLEADPNSHMPCHAHTALCRDLEKSLSERHGRGMARVRHWRSMACENQTRPHCVYQMRKTQFKSLAARHGRGMACENQTRPHCVYQMRKTQSKSLAARHGRGMGMAWHV
jgi:hypothetical protein